MGKPTCVFLLTIAILAVPVAGAAAAAPSGDHCVGLHCASPTSDDYVLGAHGDVPAVAGLDQLTEQSESGFYEIPAPFYQGDTAPPAVVYLSKPGEFGRMPASVRQLPAARDFETAAGWRAKTGTFVVIDRGAGYIGPDFAATARRRKAQAAHAWYSCSDYYTCLYKWQPYLGAITIHGPTYYGLGWFNLSGDQNNNAEAQTNHRDGDALFADGFGGNGTRYCARQQSTDSDFGNNDIGNNTVSSWALLGSSPDRC